MTPEATTAAKRLLSSVSDERDAKAVAAHAVAVCQGFSKHVSRLVGEQGVRTLFARSVALASAAFPGLRSAGSTATEAPFEALGRCLELEAPGAAHEAAVHVFQTYVELLERFIGGGLVDNLLHEVWPTIFPEAVLKETQ